MADIKNPKLLYAKGLLFVAAGALAGAALVIENPRPRTTLLLALTVWCFARAYYFAFYVVEHYADPAYRYAGLWSFARYVAARRYRRPMRPTTTGDEER